MSNARTSRWLRLGAWLAAAFGILLLLVVIGLGVYTRTDHCHRWLREQVVAALQASVNGEVTLDGVSGSVWEEMRLHGLSVRQNGVEVVSVPQAAITVHLLPQLLSLLCSSTLQITSLTLTEPVMRLVQEPEAGWNIAHLFKPPEQLPAQPQEPLALSIFLPHLNIENGRVSVRQADGQEFQVTALTLQGELALLPSGMHAEVTSLSFALAGTGIPALQWRGSLAYEESGGIGRLSLQPVEVRTVLSHLQVSGTVENLAAPTLALTAKIEELAAADLGVFLSAPRLQQDLSGSAQVSGPLSALQVVATLEAPNGRVTTAVTADLSQTPPSLQGTLQVEHFAVDKVLQIPDIAGEINGQVAFQGASLETLHAEVDVRVANLLAYGRRIGDLAIAGKLAKGQATFTAEAKGQAGQISSRSQISLSDPLAYETTLTVRNLDVAQVTGDKSAPATSMNFEVWIKGSGTKLEELDSAAKLTVLPSQLGKLTLTQGQVVGTLRKGLLTLDKGMLLANDTTVTAQGQIGGLRGTPNSKFSYSVQSKNLAPWLALAGITGEGAVNLSGTAGGTLTALSLEGKVSLAKFAVGTNSLQTGAVTYTLADVGSPQPRGHVTAALNGLRAGLRLRTVNAEVALAGLHPAEVQVEVTAQDEGSRTHHLKTQTHYDSARLEVLIQALALQLPTGTWRTPQQPQLVLRDDALSIENFSLQRAEQTVSVSGILAQQGPLNLQVQVNRFALEELRPFLGDEPEVSGRINADLQVQGTAASPDMTANLTTGALTVAGQSYAGLSAQSTYRQERLDFNLLLRQDTTHTLSVEGGLPIALGGGNIPSPVLGEANLRVRSAGLSLAFLSLLSKQVQDVQGTASMDVRLRGPVNALAPAGPVRIQQGQVRVKALGQAFTDIAVELQLAQDAVRLTQFAVHAGEGQFTGRGSVALQQYRVTNIDLTFDADRFRVINTPQYRAALSGQLTCSGSLQQPVITGALELDDTTARPDFASLKSGPAAPDPTMRVVRNAQELAVSAQPATPAIEDDTEPAPPGSRNDFYSRLALDLTVTIPRDTWVHLEEGTIELTGQLRARKDPAQELLLTGAIETVRGWYVFQRRKFRLERGNIVFIGATLIDPGLDVVARYTLPGYQVDVVVGGTAKTPTVTLRSEPQLEQADILALLLFGKPANALSKGEKVSLQSQAMQAVVGSVAGEVQQALAQNLGVDTLELDVGASPGQSKFGVGKYIAPGVFVSTSQQLGGEKPGQDVSIEYQLNDHWQLKGSTTARGNNGVDILWRKRY